MQAEVNRRVFVRSVAAGVPALAGAAYGLGAASPPNHEHDRAGDSHDLDPVLEHVVREIASVIQRGQQRGFSGEDARAIAAQLRFAVVRGGQTGIDAAAKKGVQRLIRSRPRDAALSLEIDTVKTRTQLKRYGIEVEDRWLMRGPLDEITRRKALDALANDGVTGVLAHAADMFGKVSTSLDRVQVGPVRRVQFDSFFCWPLLAEIELLAAEAAAICAIGPVEPGLEVACSTLQATISVLIAVYYAYCH